jgi:hypothetical protein
MHAQQVLPRLKAALTQAGLAYAPRFIPAEDESLDDEIILDLGGQPTALSLQFGYGYAGLQEAVFKNGKLAGVMCRRFWDMPSEPTVVADTVSFLRSRQ